jgi:tRNA(fMet)-specific endonuclease VapC
VSERYLLNTGVAGAYFDNSPAIRRKLKGAVFFLSVTVMGELYHGAYHSENRAQSLSVLRSYLSLYHPLPFNEKTAEQFGLIADYLQRRGTPIPDNDIWIAASALQYNLTVVTFDQHFQYVPNLKYEHL